MASQYRDVQCTNQSCPKWGAKSRVQAMLISSHLYAWPNVTCRGCGCEPLIIETEDPPETDIRSIAQGQ